MIGIHFCKIDVEGFERNVLEGVDFTLHRPWVMVMESTFPTTNIPNHEKWEYILLRNNYHFVYSWGINRYYIDSCNEKNYTSLKENFSKIDIENPTCELYKVVKCNLSRKSESKVKNNLKKAYFFVEKNPLKCAVIIDILLGIFIFKKNENDTTI